MKNEEDALVKRARQDARKNLDKYGGCAQSTFYAIAKNIDLGGKKEVFKAMIGLSGGPGSTTRGSCGGITGAAAAISSSVDIDPNRLEQNKDLRLNIYKNVRKVVKKFISKYGGLTCRDVQMEALGKAYDFQDEEAYKDFKEENCPEKCKNVVGNSASWATEAILEMKSRRRKNKNS